MVTDSLIEFDPVRLVRTHREWILNLLRRYDNCHITQGSSYFRTTTVTPMPHYTYDGEVTSQSIIPNEDIEVRVGLIQRNQVLSKLDAPSIHLLAEESDWLHVSKNEIIWNSGGEVRWFALIERGFVKMVNFNEQGKETTLEIMGPGQSFGCLGTVEGSGCPLAAIAITDMNILRIPKREFLTKYDQSTPLQKEMLKVSTRRLFAKLSMMAKLTTGRVDSRIANVLLMLSESYGNETELGLRIDLPLTRQDLSDFTGITLESAIRTLSSWQKAGIIQSHQSFITIVDIDGFSKIARSS
jgi:CRP-like cAMP-binding protein